MNVPTISPEDGFIAASQFVLSPPKPREWLVGDLIPAGTVTLLGGDGGTGKSLLALQLAVSVVTGEPWLGQSVRTGSALFISAEDDVEELHRRTATISRALGGATQGDMERLLVMSRAGMDALLAEMNQSKGALTPTSLFQSIEDQAKVTRPNVIVLDTFADIFPGNENDTSEVRQFIGLLRGLAIRCQCAVIMLAHPSLTGMNSGSGTSGSTGWNNSVRSRLYLERVIQDGYEANPDARVLRTMKSNYGRTGGEIALTWLDGVFVADAPDIGLDRVALSVRAERVFLRLLDEFTAQGRTVKSANATGYALKAFVSTGRADRLTKKQLHEAMERLFANGEIKEILGGDGPPSKQTKRIVRASGTGAQPCETYA
ncbi:AAA family ATPase [Yoonia litorea]|uniref:RecA-family ATPase n=1 Tax=Yoonia litorea TaxID=1123755 RepID=A0A1I6L567_9RHOB|nr:AAA family ATPase [Yoonia litorea]SFR98418.1 RecA-family ATPase [Yoonia litorea]